MKCVVFLGDGMADEPIAELGGKTPLQVARHPNMDKIATNGVLGLSVTVPDSLPAGSDIANLSILGVDPTQCYTGRSPLEAVSMGIELLENDVTYRCNLVTLSDEPQLSQRTMLDYCAGEISSEEAAQLIEVMHRRFKTEKIEFHAGVSYRHCLVLRDGNTGALLTPPHDISGQIITEQHIPKGKNSELLLEMMAYSAEAFRSHPVNLARIAAGKNPATSVWFWGEGTKPGLYDFKQRYGLRGGMISAVDLLQGIGLSMGMSVIKVEGATGNYHTNFKGKAEAAIKALDEQCDFLYIHVEAPDECGHQAQLKEKIWSIEQIDSQIIGPVMEFLERSGEDWAVMVAPDHPTPIALKTHTRTPVPFAYCKKGQRNETPREYNEQTAADSGVFVPRAHELLGLLLSKE